MSIGFLLRKKQVLSKNLFPAFLTAPACFLFFLLLFLYFFLDLNGIQFVICFFFLMTHSSRNYVIIESWLLIKLFYQRKIFDLSGALHMHQRSGAVNDLFTDLDMFLIIGNNGEIPGDQIFDLSLDLF